MFTEGLWERKLPNERDFLRTLLRKKRICEKAIFRRQRFVLYAVGMAQGLQSRSVGFGQRLHRSAQQGAAALMYKRPENIQTVIHTFHITKENLYALEQMRASYGIRMSLLVNIAIAYLCKPDAGTDASI